MAEHNELYRRAIYYDIIFNRDVSHEIDFVCALYRTYNHAEPGSALDLACGPAYHARACAARGMRSVGLDLRAEMVALARERAGDMQNNLTLMAGDMRAFELVEPVDVAFSMFDSIDCLLTNDDIVRHFRAVAANLQPHGLYLIDLTHPRDCSLYYYSDFRYTGERAGCSVQIDWATNRPVVDPLTQVIDVEVTMRVDDNGVTHAFTDRASERLLFAQEIQALAELSGVLAVRDFYGDFSLAQPFDSTPASRRMIAVLQKQEPGWSSIANSQQTSYLSSKLETRSMPATGTFGVFAIEPIAAGETLAVWGGNVVGFAELASLSERAQLHALQVERDLFLAPNRPAELADYVNHSCDPNAGLQGQIQLVALRTITPGEQVCYDYAMSDSAVNAPFACACGAPNCRGMITIDDWRRPDLQMRYAGYFSPYLERQIDRSRR